MELMFAALTSSRKEDRTMAQNHHKCMQAGMDFVNLVSNHQSQSLKPITLQLLTLIQDIQANVGFYDEQANKQLRTHSNVMGGIMAWYQHELCSNIAINRNTIANACLNIKDTRNKIASCKEAVKQGLYQIQGCLNNHPTTSLSTNAWTTRSATFA
jgi:hypothetical protein